MLSDLIFPGEVHHRVAELILERLEVLKVERPVITISGESGSGKSTIAHVLASLLKARGQLAKILHLDNHHITPPIGRTAWRLEQGEGVIGPSEIDWASVDTALDAFAERKLCRLPIVDLMTDQVDVLETSFEPIDALIVEGLWAVKVEACLSVFLEPTYHECLEAQLTRGKEEIGPDRLWILEAEHRESLKLKDQADLLISSDFLKVTEG